VAKERADLALPSRSPQPCRSEGALGGGPSPPGQAEVGQEEDGLLLRHRLPIPTSVYCTQTQVSQLIQANKDLIQLGPPFLGPRKCISVWEALGADQTILKVIRQGVRLSLTCLPPPTPRTPMLLQELENQMEEYIQLGVARPLTQMETQSTRCWVQTFGREKPNSSKVRIITNLKPLNQCFRVDNFRSDHWGTVLQTLQNHPDCR
jgi:hypothetical protein